MNESIIFERKLELIRLFQEKYPTSHIGGSMGLFLRGINIGRSVHFSDVDIIIDEIDTSEIQNESWLPLSCFDDFKAAYRVFYGDKYGFNYTKFEISEQPDQTFDTIFFNHNIYNVSKLSNILLYKNIYANKGVLKHAEDLYFIATGLHIGNNFSLNNVDDDDGLPF